MAQMLLDIEIEVPRSVALAAKCAASDVLTISSD